MTLVRICGSRCLTAMSPYDIGCIVAVGAVLGRTALLSVPTLGSGIVALVTFFMLQRLFGSARRTRLLGGLLQRRPVLLMTGSAIRHDELHRARVSLDELRQRLRLSGITRLDDVGWVVLEVNGQISVARRDPLPDPFLLCDVSGRADPRQQ